MFAKPNTIDFSKAFAGFSNIGDNPTVFATTLSIIGVYFLLLAYCRYKDKKDIEKVSILTVKSANKKIIFKKLQADFSNFKYTFKKLQADFFNLKYQNTG